MSDLREFEERIAQFWGWFAGAGADIRSQFQDAASRQDYPALKAASGQIAARVDALCGGIHTQVGEGFAGTCTLGLAPVDPQDQAVVDWILAAAPRIDGWTFGLKPDTELANVIVRDDLGRELTIARKRITFLLLPPQPDGSVGVMLGFDEEFDPNGPDGHLYQAAAHELVNSTFFGVPPGMGSCALVPHSWLIGHPTRPMAELKTAWQQRSDGVHVRRRRLTARWLRPRRG